jgi:MFS family permease
MACSRWLSGMSLSSTLRAGKYVYLLLRNESPLKYQTSSVCSVLCKWDSSIEYFSWALTPLAQSIGYIASIPFAPYISDGLGRRTAIVIGAILMIIATALQTVSQSIGMFIGARSCLSLTLVSWQHSYKINVQILNRFRLYIRWVCGTFAYHWDCFSFTSRESYVYIQQSLVSWVHSHFTMYFELFKGFWVVSCKPGTITRCSIHHSTLICIFSAAWTVRLIVVSTSTLSLTPLLLPRLTGHFISPRVGHGESPLRFKDFHVWFKSVPSGLYQKARGGWSVKGGRSLVSRICVVYLFSMHILSMSNGLI